jgi:tRNA A-37 threonylcarbamoyl transferase component Bud32
MSLAPGARFGPYEVIGSLGAGGMGEVYRARDTKLHRDVALKLLPDAFARDPDRLARFEREAQTLAALNHAHVAQIHGLEEKDGVRALVMELVEGADLSQRIARGPIAVDETIGIARQIAEALEAAHERGIVHRDLKPANIKVRDDGTVKVLDFGLAKAFQATSDASPMNSPTLTSPAQMTHAGIVLGTAAYMAPEQAAGRTVDKRADIWAFGCVVFEMLTGRPVFTGESVTETLAAVMRDPPRFDQLPATTPPPVRRLIGRCLDRDLKRRLRDIGEARITLDEAIAHPDQAIEQPRMVAPPAASVGSRAIPWAIAALAVAAAGYFAIRAAPSAARDSVEVEIGAPQDGQFLIDSNSGNVSLSPDGTKILFRAVTAGRDALWIRSLSRDDARALAGTENAQYQFWAPDSRRLAFFAAGKLKTLDTAAGLPQVIADAPNGRGGSWGDDDVILFAPMGGGTISRVSAGGGKAEVVTHLDTSRGENAHYWPQILPGGRRFLYFVRGVRPENNGIYVAAMDGSGATRVISSLSSGIYAPPLDGRPGHLLWVQNNELLAQPFDADRGALGGRPTTIASGVRVIESQRGLLASVSRTGVVAWASPRAPLARFAWYDRDGRRREAVPIDEADLQQPAISPDGARLLYTRVANGTADIFLYDIAVRSSRRITTNPDYDEQPMWSPDGAEMLYSGTEQAQNAIIRVRLDSSVPPAQLIRDRVQIGAVAWSPDRRHILFSKSRPGSGDDILAFPADDPTKITPLLTGPANESWASFSPDGKWIAFSSDRSGRYEAYVVRFRGDQSTPALGGAPVQISSDGGIVLPGGWRRDGKEIVLAFDGQIVGVPIDTRGESISAGRPALLFRLPFNQSAAATTSNADRFLISEFPYAAGQTIHVLTNWHQRLAGGKS